MYNYWARITIDNTKVAEDDADFVFLFSGTYAGVGEDPDLRTVANEGHVHNTASGGASGALTVPADLVFSLRPDGLTKLNFEVERYTAATGELVAWVQASISSTIDTVLYLVYGDKGVATSQENVTETWDTAHKCVLHLNNAFDDSSPANHDATNHGSDDIAGKIGQGRDFIPGNLDYIGVATHADFNFGSGAFTVEMWAKFDNLSANRGLYSKGTNGESYWQLRTQSNGEIRVAVYSANVGIVDFKSANGQFVTATWYHIAVTRSNNTWTIYKNGASIASTSDASAIPDYTGDVGIGVVDFNAGLFGYIDGILDEVRVSKGVARSSNYLTTAYNSQNSPGTFYSVSGADRVRPCSGPSLPGLIIA